MMQGLELNDITASYDGVVALDGLTLQVTGGSIHAIIGERRAGKSSIVSLLEGNMTLVKGRIVINGVPLAHANPQTILRAGVGIFHQTPNVIPTLTPWENIMAGHRSIGISSRHLRGRIEESISSLCGKWNLHPDLRVPVRKLSRIESTVIELERALAFDPRVLILDEPSGRFTADEMQILYAVLKERRSPGEAILYVASNVDEILKIADMLSIMKSGRIVETQPVRSLDREDLVDLAYSFSESREELVSKNIRLLKYKKYNEDIVSNLPLGTVLFDGDGTAYLSNRSAHDILSTSPNEQFRQPPEGSLLTENPITAGELREGLGDENFLHVMDAVKSGTTAQWKQLPTTKGRFVDVMMYPFHDSLNQLFGTILVMQDVTEERTTRDYLARVERTSSIAQLAAGVVHEVNNPLGIISNYVELLLMKAKDRYSKDRLEIVRSEIQRIHGSMLNLLSFSSIDSSTLVPHDLGLVVRESLTLLEYEAERLAITLKADIPPEPVMVRMDPARIKQVLINLLINALDAVEKNGDIIVEVGKKPDNSVLMCVRDTGPGIAPDRIGNLFTPFFSSKNGNGHAGLGLSICKHITEVHGGRIWCESEPGNTAFFVELPGERKLQGKDLTGR